MFKFNIPSETLFEIKSRLQIPGYVDFSFKGLDWTHFGLGVEVCPTNVWVLFPPKTLLEALKIKAEFILGFYLEYGDDISWFGQVCPSALASRIGGLCFILRMSCWRQ